MLESKTFSHNQSLQISYLPLASLKPHPTNARTHSKRQIKQISESLQEFGWTNPILIDDALNVVAGHGRMEAAKLLGMDIVPTMRLGEMTEAQRRAYMIADNKLAEQAGWDKSLLKFEFSEILALDSSLDLTVTGFSIDEIDILFDDADAGAEGDLEKAASGPPVTIVGDLWTLGTHRLLCGDARDEASYYRLLGSDRAQMVFTDPPYNVPIAGNVSGLGKVRHGEFVMASGEMSKGVFTEFLTTVLKQLAAASVDGSIHYVCMDWRHMQELGTAGEAAYSELKNLVVWDKGCGGMGSFYRNQHEFIFAYKKGTAKHINNFALGQHGRYRTNIWSCPGANSFKSGRQDELVMHPTVKPVELIVEAMRDCSKKMASYSMRSADLGPP
jgi:hypothetical protein